MANEMRDRLVEYIENAKKLYEGDVTDLTESEYVAECLLTDGVIVPPCEVGDTVYVVENPYTFVPLKKVLEGYVMSIHQHEHGLFLRVLFDTKKINGSVDYNLDWRLGETVFLTKEQAEQKLKEMRGD